MITFKNIITNNTFTLPQAKAIEIINHSPDVFKVLSKVDETLLKKVTPIISKDLSTDIYDLVVQDKTEKISLKKKGVVKSRVVKTKRKGN